LGSLVIDNAQALPLYHQVAGILRQRIEDGIYPVGGKLLSEDELAAEFEVSRATIRQAVGELVIEGLVVRRQGRGTYVEARDPNVLQQRFRGSLGDLINESHRAKTRNVEVAHDAPIPVHIAEALQLDSPTGTIVKRTRTMDGQPFALTITYLPPDLGKAITPAGLRKKALMELLMDGGISLSSASQSIRAQLADIDVCSQIDVELGAAVLFVERIVHDTAGRPVEYVRSWYRGDRYEYAVTLDLAEGQDGNPYLKLALRACRNLALRPAAEGGQAAAATRAARAMSCSSSATASAGSSLALCGVELSRPNVACTAVRRLAWAARGDSSLSTVTHSSTYSRCRRRICRRAGSGTLASSRPCTVIRSGWLSAKLTCQRSSASSASAALAAADARRPPSSSSRSLMSSSICDSTASLPGKCR
jgi:GntR family transcriptional regulator